MFIPRSVPLVSVLVAITLPAAAQQSPPPVLTVGSRVRIVSPAYGAPRHVVGTITALSTDTVSVVADSGGNPIAVPLATTTQIEVSIRRQSAGSRFGHGAGIGFLFGGAVGAVAGLASGDDPPDTFLRFTAGQKAVLLGISLGAVGSLIGGLVGLGSGGDVWQPVTPGPLRVTLEPVHSGMRLGLSLRL